MERSQAIELCEERRKAIIKLVANNTRDIEGNSTDIKELVKVSIRLATIVELHENEKEEVELKPDFWNTKAGMFLMRSVVIVFVALLTLTTGINILSMLPK